MEPELGESKNNLFQHKIRKLKCLADDAVKDLFGTIKEHCDITELDLLHNVIGENGCMHLSAALPATRIERLHLSCNQIKCQGAKHLGQCVKNTVIDYLDLGRNELGDNGVANLAQGLEGSNVSYLDLRRNDITDCGVFYLCQVLPRTRIQTLDLSCNHIGNEGAKFLGECLKFTQISSLYLGFNGMGDEGLAYFVQGLKGSHIESLDFSGNSFGDDGLKSFVNALKSTQIVEIGLDGMGIDAARYLHSILHQTKLEKYLIEVSTSKSLNCIFQSMNCLDGIKIFDVFLNSNDIGFDGAAYLNELFQKFSLHHLSLINKELKTDQVQCLAQAFETIKIDCLEINRCQLAQVDGIRLLVEIFKNSQISRIDNKFKKMESSGIQCLAGFLNKISVFELCLRHSNLNDECIPYLIPALKTNRILKLDLSSNQVSSTGVGYLAPVIEYNQITHLNLSDNAIGDLGAKHLSDCLKNSQLKHIDISENGISQIGYQQLVRAIDNTNVSLILCSPLSDIQRDETATTAYKICHAFKTLVGLNPLSDEYQFILPKDIHDCFIDEFVLFIKTLTDHPQVKAHIFNVMCFREINNDCDCVNFDTMDKITKFIDELSEKFNALFNDNFLAFPACDYVEFTEKLEAMQLFDIVQNLLLHRELFYVDSNKEILHPFICKLLYKYKMPLYSEELEPNKKNAIIAFYENYSNDNDVKDLLHLLM